MLGDYKDLLSVPQGERKQKSLEIVNKFKALILAPVQAPVAVPAIAPPAAFQVNNLFIFSGFAGALLIALMFIKKKSLSKKVTFKVDTSSSENHQIKSAIIEDISYSDEVILEEEDRAKGELDLYDLLTAPENVQRESEESISEESESNEIVVESSVIEEAAIEPVIEAVNAVVEGLVIAAEQSEHPVIQDESIDAAPQSGIDKAMQEFQSKLNFVLDIKLPDLKKQNFAHFARGLDVLESQLRKSVDMLIGLPVCNLNTQVLKDFRQACDDHFDNAAREFASQPTYLLVLRSIKQFFMDIIAGFMRFSRIANAPKYTGTFFNKAETPESKVWKEIRPALEVDAYVNELSASLALAG
ncbi:MAG: hypothetical protein B7X00_00760 [Legionella sp. 21-45-4]|nr:MAG: hypothetical protein B7X00_00760 [Legionella sp. 21-45-4]